MELMTGCAPLALVTRAFAPTSLALERERERVAVVFPPSTYGRPSRSGQLRVARKTNDQLSGHASRARVFVAGCWGYHPRFSEFEPGFERGFDRSFFFSFFENVRKIRG